jgi:hypothetical protein
LEIQDSAINRAAFWQYFLRKPAQVTPERVKGERGQTMGSDPIFVIEGHQTSEGV